VAIRWLSRATTKNRTRRIAVPIEGAHLGASGSYSRICRSRTSCCGVKLARSLSAFSARQSAFAAFLCWQIILESLIISALHWFSFHPHKSRRPIRKQCKAALTGTCLSKTSLLRLARARRRTNLGVRFGKTYRPTYALVFAREVVHPGHR
jgi:hypothetical protein